LFRGNDVARDVPEAIRLWTLSADRGNAIAQFNLAKMYMTGQGVPRDLQKARSLFTSAGRNIDVSRELNYIASQTNGGSSMKTQADNVNH
jgi:TPR repeat protein